MTNIPCVPIPVFLCPFVSWWTFLLLPCLGYGKYCCNTRCSICVFLILVFTGARPNSEPSGPYGNSMFTFSTHCHSVPIIGCYQFTSHLDREVTLFSTTSSTSIVCWLFADGHFDWWEVIPLCRLDLHVSNNSWWFAFINALFVFLKIELNLQLQIAFLKNLSRLDSFGHFLPQDSFWGNESFTALQSLWILVTISSGFKTAVWGNGLRVAAFLHCQLCLLGKENLAASCAFRLQIRVECVRTNPHKF